MRATSYGQRSLADHPARFVVVAFLVAIAAGTLVLMLPFSTADGGSPTLIDALFTSTSAVCVTGLTVVDTGTYWSPFGQVVILVLFQLGGLGFMTMMSLIVLAVSRRLGIRATLAAQTERRSLSLGDVRSVLKGVAVVTVTVELLVGLLLSARLITTYGHGVGSGLWHGFFHSVSAFNNAGFSLNEDSLMPFVNDPVVILPVTVAVILGGLGFPVLVDLYRHLRRPGRLRRHMHLTLHSRLTLVMTVILLFVGLVLMLGFEWRNPDTFGPMALHEKGLAGMFTAVTPRTTGFTVVETGAMTDEGLLSTMVLMFIGAGSAGTSGGIKVGTFAVIGLVVLAELRSREAVNAFGRRIPQAVQRQAITVAALSMGVVVVTALGLMVGTDHLLKTALFEAVSTFGTVGLTTGTLDSVPGGADLLLMATMLIGRLGPATLGAALVLTRRAAAVRYPEEGPIIG